MNGKRLGRGILFVGVSLIVGTAMASASNDNHDNQAVTSDLITHYLAIQTALAGDSLDQVSEHAAALKNLAGAALKEKDNQGDPSDHGSASAAAAATDQLAKATNLEQARRAFGELSDALVESGDLVLVDGLKVAYCPMAKRHWLQTGDQISNPYYGSRMLRCGNFVAQPETTPSGN
ncbi:hypothetical protein COW53_07685 [bacterium CG17_big_fil_post_rev_8_21_14_2_50_64_8]|nr:MAG: hypothetical protein COW53_07685 [bacterium CG17_big_fil_post_rev_8_21_14_2_50_64_8]PJA76465.1 MAG: hypothetical protein CO151_02615 [bacterium CG_4_9_14_3_um_filter_65_15]